MFGDSSKKYENEYEARIAALEEELKEAKQRTQLESQKVDILNRSTHLGIWTAYYGDNGEISDVEFSDEFRDMIGYTKIEFPDSMDSLSKIIHKDYIESVFAAYGAAAADKSNRTKYDIDYPLLTKQDGYKWFHAAGDCIRRPNGLPRVFIGTFTDIDEKKKTSEVLEVQQRRQGAVDLMMLEGTWSMDLTKYAIDNPNSPMVFSTQFKEILGFGRGHEHEFPDIMQSWISRIHPDDVAGASAKMGEQLADPSGKTVFDMEYRMKHRNGKYIWLRSSSTVVWSRDKVPLMAAGTILDITEQKNNKLRFEQEMAPNIQSLKNGITEIASSVDNATRQMNEMAERQVNVSEFARKIEKAVDASMTIIVSIQSIANRTNLLSLNASIEAARAGEAGRGFAVVATEIGQLANNSADATKQIADIIQGMTEKVRDLAEKSEANTKMINDSSEAITNAAATFKQITEDLSNASQTLSQMAQQMGTVNDVASNMASVSEEQSATSMEITNTINQLTESSRNVAESSSTVSDAAASVAEAVDQINDSVSFFTIDAAQKIQAVLDTNGTEEEEG